MTPDFTALKILLVSPDLMATSRIAGLCREAGASLETLRSLADVPHGGPHDIVLLDLQALAEDPAVVVTRARVLAARMLGRTTLIHLEIAEPRVHLHARVRGQATIGEGESVAITLDPALAFVFDPAQAE